MVFGLFKRRKPQPPADPLAAFDEAIDAVSRQGAAVRRSAATLLAARGELERGLARERRNLEELGRRLEEARARQDGRAEKTLDRDQVNARQRIAATEEALARAEGDAQLLLETAEGLQVQLTELEAERVSARMRVAAGEVITAALQPPSEAIRQALALDQARDEVERAHALAELYREEKSARGE